MTEYRLVFLTPGQQAPKGSTSIALSNGGIVWAGDDGTFSVTAKKGVILPNDKAVENEYSNRLATNDEITKYKDIVANPENYTLDR